MGGEVEEEEVEDEGEDGSLAYSPPVPEDLLVITADLSLIGEFLGPPGLHLKTRDAWGGAFRPRGGTGQGKNSRGWVGHKNALIN